MVENSQETIEGYQKLGSIGIAVHKAYPHISDGQLWVFVIMLKMLFDDNKIDYYGRKID